MRAILGSAASDLWPARPPSQMPKVQQTDETGKWDLVEPDRHEEGPTSVNLIRMSEVEPEPIDWLWPGRLPKGKVVIFDGDPGLGKSAMTIDFAARVSTGRSFPGEATAEPAAGVIVVTAEDGISDTVQPRLVAAGANLDKVFCLAGVGTGKFDNTGAEVERSLVIFEDIGLIEKMITETGAALLILDVLTAFLGDKKANTDQDMRSILTPLAKVAERTGCCIIGLRHLNKAQGLSAIYRGGGSIGISGAARVTLIVGNDPDDDDIEDPNDKRRVLAIGKVNIARRAPSLSYRTVEVEVEGPAGKVVKIEWLGESVHDADKIVHAEGAADDDGDDEVIAFLKTALEDGEVLSKVITKEAAGLGISPGQLRWGRKRLHVKAVKEKTMNGGWLWMLPTTNK